jgi:DNA-binding PadR family transcriptional regulator
MMEKQLFLLGLLRTSDMYGYQILELISTHFGISVNITKPTAYRILHKMEADGWITFREEQEGNRPSRRVYSLASSGEAAFQKLLRRSLAEYQPAEHPSMVSLAFIEMIPAEEALPLMKKRKEIVEGYLQKVIEAEKHQGEYHLVIEHQLRHLETELKWIENVIEKISNRP